MKFITNYGKSLDDRRAVRRPGKGVNPMVGWNIQKLERRCKDGRSDGGGEVGDTVRRESGKWAAGEGEYGTVSVGQLGVVSV